MASLHHIAHIFFTVFTKFNFKVICHIVELALTELIIFLLHPKNLGVSWPADRMSDDFLLWVSSQWQLPLSQLTSNSAIPQSVTALFWTVSPHQPPSALSSDESSNFSGFIIHSDQCKSFLLRAANED